MSNLFKSGFQNLTPIKNEPFVFDANSKKFKQDENVGRIIRPLEEKVSDDNQDEDNIGNQVILEDAMDLAKSMQEEAKVKAAQILADAEAEAANIFEQAKEQGFQQGLEEGNMEAMKRADVYLEKIQREQDELIQRNQEELEKKMQEAEESMVELICKFVEKLTGIMVADYKPVLLYMINASLTNSETSRNYNIKVSEQSYPYISENKDRIIGASNPSINMEIFGDPKLSTGQCIIETDNGIIDLSMDVQVKNLITAIKMMS